MTSHLVKHAQTPTPVRYTSKIIKAGALLSDTKLLLAQWDLSASVSANLERMRQENVFGKASRARVADILTIFRQRYLADQEVLAALVTLAHDRASSSMLDPILYFLAARADPLLRDTVLEVLTPMLARGHAMVRTLDVTQWLLQQVAAGRTQGAWSEKTATRIAQGLLATLRDFGVLEGMATKRLAPMYLPIPAFALLAFILRRRQSSGDKLLRDPEWALFFLEHASVERLFLEAHQDGVLEYHAAGRVIRVDFPATSIEEYAHALARRAFRPAGT